jgi:hypothetical protein
MNKCNDFPMYGICGLSRWIGYNIVARCKERGVSSKGYSS